MIIIRTKYFTKTVIKLPANIKNALADRLQLLISDPFNVILNNHALSGDRQPYRSINITGDYRLVYEQYDEDTVRLIDIDTHSNLY
ncbi:MAG: type II toxin-antitoxin system mRNA interferase toxin, RelE/StbE family [Candidatus Yonathbacteria bacterium]|nr:type II toxin-antitoxin system mRNA interferase toxin, RelE/StbE family [Candidatus Yonathbacteria bacterium]